MFVRNVLQTKPLLTYVACKPLKLFVTLLTKTDQTKISKASVKNVLTNLALNKRFPLITEPNKTEKNVHSAEPNKKKLE